MAFENNQPPHILTFLRLLIHDKNIIHVQYIIIYSVSRSTARMAGHSRKQIFVDDTKSSRRDCILIARV